MSEQRKFKGGYNFAGIEEAYEAMLVRAMNNSSTPYFRYLEIGIAEGTTLVSTAEVCRDHGPHNWQCVGIDIFDGPFFNERNFLKKSLAFNVGIEFPGRGNHATFVADRMGDDIRILLLKGDTTRALVSPGCVNFCLIDGCHGAPCVEKDFLSIEAGIARGGIVAFHDAMPEDQGKGWQSHCQQNINVRHALSHLGLQSNLGDLTTRPGWQYAGCAHGDKSLGDLSQNGNGIIFFQKV
jgi:hypothetical protein